VLDTLNNDGAGVTHSNNCHLDPHNPSLFLGFSIVGDVAHVEVEEKLFEFLFDLFFREQTRFPINSSQEPKKHFSPTYNSEFSLRRTLFIF
jgi:hypothetical protein